MPEPRMRRYDDRWMNDAVTRLRVNEAVSSIEREYDIACAAISRGDVEDAIGHPLDDREWTGVREELRREREACMRALLQDLVAARRSRAS